MNNALGIGNDDPFFREAPQDFFVKVAGYPKNPKNIAGENAQLHIDPAFADIHNQGNGFWNFAASRMGTPDFQQNLADMINVAVQGDPDRYIDSPDFILMGPIL